jgi:hypothetical protein
VSYPQEGNPSLKTIFFDNIYHLTSLLTQGCLQYRLVNSQLTLPFGNAHLPRHYCAAAWGLRIIESSNVQIAGAGLYNVRIPDSISSPDFAVSFLRVPDSVFPTTSVLFSYPARSKCKFANDITNSVLI